MLTALLLATQLQTADATEIARGKMFGLGVTVGLPSAITGKYWLSEKAGVSAFLGSNYNASYGARVQFDMAFWEIVDLDWSRIEMYWFVGGQSYVVGNVLGVAAVGGVGGAMQFHEFPLEVFVEAGSSFGPRPGGGLLWGPAGVTGARWYF